MRFRTGLTLSNELSFWSEIPLGGVRPRKHQRDFYFRASPCQSAIVFDCSEIASGLNDNRRQFFKIIDAACKGEVKRVVVEHRDRLTRFGFKTIERFFNGVGCTIEVLEQKEGKSEHEELVEDILTIIVSFSSRIYDARGGRKRKENTDAESA